MKSRGFTLIELMIAIALFGLIASGAIVLSGVRMQSRSARVDIAQSAARTGLDFLTRDLLSASAGASAGYINIGATQTLSISFTDGGATGPDTLDIYSADTTNGFATSYTTSITGATTSLSVDLTSMFAANQTVLLSNLTNACTFTIGGLTPPVGTGAGTISVASGLSTGVGTTTYSPYSSYIFPLRHVTYAISQPFTADTATANNSYLMLNMNDGNGWQPVAEGVEDLQVAFGYDPDGNGIVDSGSASDEWYGNATGDNAAAQQTIANAPYLKAVRVTLVAKSTSPEAGVSGGRPQVENHTAGANDGFFRRIIRTEVTVRNLNI